MVLQFGVGGSTTLKDVVHEPQILRHEREARLAPVGRAGIAPHHDDEIGKPGIKARLAEHRHAAVGGMKEWHGGDEALHEFQFGPRQRSPKDDTLRGRVPVNDHRGNDGAHVG
jgi:hypothetical protein